jgi:hypothetical protein
MEKKEKYKYECKTEVKIIWKNRIGIICHVFVRNMDVRFNRH